MFHFITFLYFLLLRAFIVSFPSIFGLDREDMCGVGHDVKY